MFSEMRANLKIRIRFLTGGVLCALAMSTWSALPVAATEGAVCPPESSKYFGDCPLPFDSGNPRQVLRRIVRSGIECAKPTSAGSDALGGKYLRCTVAGNPLIIRAYPTNRAYRDASLGRIGVGWKLREFDRLGWGGCVSISLEAFRYQVEVWASDTPLTAESHGALLRSLQTALGIPSQFTYDKATGYASGTQFTWKGKLGRNDRGCSFDL